LLLTLCEAAGDGAACEEAAGTNQREFGDGHVQEPGSAWQTEVRHHRQRHRAAEDQSSRQQQS